MNWSINKMNDVALFSGDAGEKPCEDGSEQWVLLTSD